MVIQLREGIRPSQVGGFRPVISPRAGEMTNDREPAAGLCLDHPTWRCTADRVPTLPFLGRLGPLAGFHRYGAQHVGV